MAIFLITPFSGQVPLDAEIKSAISEHERYPLKSGGWLIKFDGTSKELSDKLKITSDTPADASIATAMVAAISGYYGRGPTDMWEWIASRMK